MIPAFRNRISYIFVLGDCYEYRKSDPWLCKSEQATEKRSLSQDLHDSADRQQAIFIELPAGILGIRISAFQYPEFCHDLQQQ